MPAYEFSRNFKIPGNPESGGSSGVSKIYRIYLIYIYRNMGVFLSIEKNNLGIFNYFNQLFEGFEDSSFFQINKLKDAIF